METLIKNVNILNPNEEIQTSCNVLIEDKNICDFYFLFGRLLCINLY